MTQNHNTTSKMNATYESDGENQTMNGKPVLYRDAKTVLTLNANATIVPLPVLTAEDIQYREEREQIVSRAVNTIIDASRALYEIKNHRDGALWKSEFKSFEAYCYDRWGYKKSQAYRLAETGGFVVDVESNSPRGEKLPVNEAQVRPLIALVPEEFRVDCWNHIVEDKDPDQMSASQVSTEARKYLADHRISPRLSAKSKVASQCAKEMSAKKLTALKKVLDTLSVPRRFDQLIRSIAMLINQDAVPSDDDRVGDNESVGTPMSHRLPDRNGPAPYFDQSQGYRDIESGNDHQTEDMHDLNHDAPGQEVGIMLVNEDTVAMTMAECEPGTGQPPMASVAPSHERSMTTTIVPRRHLPVTAKHDRIESALPMPVVSNAPFMSAQIFHQALHQGADYEKWLVGAAASYPADVLIPEDGEAERISLCRAKSIAFNAKGNASTNIFKLLIEAENSGGNPGVVADALFKKHALATESAEISQS